VCALGVHFWGTSRNIFYFHIPQTVWCVELWINVQVGQGALFGSPFYVGVWVQSQPQDNLKCTQTSVRQFLALMKNLITWLKGKESPRHGTSMKIYRSTPPKWTSTHKCTNPDRWCTNEFHFFIHVLTKLVSTCLLFFPCSTLISPPNPFFFTFFSPPHLHLVSCTYLFFFGHLLACPPIYLPTYPPTYQWPQLKIFQFTK